MQTEADVTIMKMLIMIIIVIMIKNIIGWSQSVFELNKKKPNDLNDAKEENSAIRALDHIRMQKTQVNKERVAMDCFKLDQVPRKVSRSNF